MISANILVIGSAHLDIFAEFKDVGQEVSVDKIGSRVDFDVGGTALNIAAWMQELGHKASLLTALNKSSFTGRAVLTAMRAGGLSRKYIIDDERLSESAFVATVKNKDLYSAISCMGIGQSTDSIIAKLEIVAAKFSWIIFDCNLSVEVIRKISEISKSQNIPIVGAATSAVKALNLLATQSIGTRALCMNRDEAAALQKALSIAEGVSDESLKELQRKLNTRTLLVTDGEYGWYLIDSAVNRNSTPAGVVPLTTIGAGDAACAGLVNALAKGEKSESVCDTINLVVARALQVRSPTKFSELTSRDAIRQFDRSRRRTRIALTVILFVSAVIVTWFIELGLQSFMETFLG